MLKNQETNVETPTVSIAQARVTPEELSSALAAIEARRQAEASRLAGTIPIEEAVSSLHLDSTPDEIWAEVLVQRARAEAAQTQSFAAADAARREQLRQTQATQQSRQQVTTPPRVRRNRRWMGIFAPILLVWVFAQTGIIPQFWHHHTQMPHVAQTPHVAKLTTLAKIPDGQEVYADSATLVQLSEGASPLKIKVDENQTDNGWKVFNRGGHVYVKGYILRTDSPQSLQGKPLNIYNDNNSGELEGETTSDITQRVDQIPLQNSGGNHDYSEVTISDFQIDPMTTFTEGD